MISFFSRISTASGRFFLLFAICATISGPARAAGEAVVKGEQYVPGIWIDPDGCEHWVMDDGFEGFMTPHVTRDGRPVCHSGNTCAELNSDQLFSSNGSGIGPGNRARLLDFFRNADAQSFIIAGHTDSRASDAYNMRLSLSRAKAVARIAAKAGASVFDVRGYGERFPKASNQTQAGMAKNRRVEIICLH